MKLSSALLLLLALQSGASQYSSTETTGHGHDAFVPRLLEKDSHLSIGSNYIVEKIPSTVPGNKRPARATAGRNLEMATISASKVRIQLYGETFLHLREVQVIDKDGNNVALTGSASHSSEYYTGREAWRSIDGDICMPADHNSNNNCGLRVSTTANEQGAWWEVQLDNVYDIQQVKIYNRNEPESALDYSARLSNSFVSLWDGDSILASVDIDDASGVGLFEFSAADFTPVPWEINFSSLQTDFTTESEDEIRMDYLVGKERPYRHYLYQKDCNSTITDIAISTTASLARMKGSYNSLSLAYSMDKSAIGNSTIWNNDASQIEICQVVQLTESVANPPLLMVISEDIRNVTVNFNLTSDFRIEVNQTGATINNSTDEASLASYIIAFHCDGISMGDTVADLGPNDVLHVCIQSLSPDVEIKALNSMVIRGNTLAGVSETLPVIAEDAPSIPQITTKEHPSATSVVVSTRVPSNVFNFAPGASIAATGDVTLNLAGSERKLRIADVNRKLQTEGATEFETDEDVSYEVVIGLQADSADEMDDVQVLNFAQIVEVDGFAVLAAIATIAYAMW